MNTEQLKTLYNRVEQYCLAAYGIKPHEIIISNDGQLIASFMYDSYGSCYTEHECFDIEQLTEDLDEVYNNRISKEKEERIKQDKIDLEHQKRMDSLAKEQRKETYLKLKKEFE